MKNLRALVLFFFIGTSALSIAQDFFFENELGFKLDRKCAEKDLIPSNLFQETEDLILSTSLLSSISGDDYKFFCKALSKTNFSFDSILITDDFYDKHVAYYSNFNGLWQEMWIEDSAFAEKSVFYQLKSTIDSCTVANPNAGVANTFTAFLQMPEVLFFTPFYRNLLLNWAIVAYFEPQTGISVALPKTPVYDLSGVYQNVLVIRINSEDEILIAGDKNENKSTLVEVRNRVIKHITNEGKDPNLALSSGEAIVSLKNETGTSYQAYVNLYNEIVGAYNIVRNEYAQKVFLLPFNKLSEEQQKIVRAKYPQKIAEAEPVSTEK